MPRKGYKQTKEHKRKVKDNRSSFSGKNNPMYGRKQKQSSKDKIRQSLIGKYTGEKSGMWQGGKSFELYGFEWTDLLKHAIRTRDCFVCQICKKNGWVVHHIDYDKKNCNPNNLITLCNSCHSKTNFNRDYWLKYFYELFKK